VSEVSVTSFRLFHGVADKCADIGNGGSSPAQGTAAIFKDKTIDIYTGYTVGGGYDLYTRLLARHVGKHLPGKPTVVPKNMEGAASIRFANWLYNVAPKDGTAFGTIGRGTAMPGALPLRQGFIYQFGVRAPNRPSASSFGPAVKYTVSGLPPLPPLPTRRLHSPSMAITFP
jgi:hypothetical protein